MSMPPDEARPPEGKRPWWLPFTSLGVILMVVGLWMIFVAHDGRFQIIGRICASAGGIALAGVALSSWSWGRAIMGVRARTSRWFPFLFTMRGWIQAAVITIVFGTVGFFEYTMHPDFCQSCHVMVPYYEAWHESTHVGVKCTDCHFAPGIKETLRGKWQASSMLVRYLTKTYGSMPHAQIEDASCLRSGCHSTRVLEGKVAWKYEKPNGAIVNLNFDHKPHLTEMRRGRQLRCTSCHSQIVQGQHITVTLDTCYTCHFKGLHHGRDQEVLGGCTACHPAPKEQIRLSTGVFNHSEYIGRGVACYNCHSDSIKGDGEVPRQVCLNCHNKPHQLDRYGDTNFIHDNHITKHKLACFSCHIQIQHGLAPKPSIVTESSCNSCHEQTHGGPAELYRGVGGKGVPDMPSPMFRAQVDCIACHQFKEHDKGEADVVGQTYVASQKSCDMCHGDTPDPAGGKYATKLGEWKETLKGVTERTETAVRKADGALAESKLSDAERLPLRRKLADARHNLELVQLGHGVHNLNYSVALLNTATEWCNEIIDACTRSANEPSKGPAP